MAENVKLFPLRCLPGIKRDGTSTEGNFWNEGQWSRFYRGLPRSISGYRSMSETYPGPSRGLFMNPNGTGYLDIFSGSVNALTAAQFTTDGFGGGTTDITPAFFNQSPNNVWQFDAFFNKNGGNYTALIAHAGQNLAAIDNDVETPVYQGNIFATTALTSAGISVSGGIVALTPYMIAYGNFGIVNWSSINDPTSWPIANSANICATKIVKGMSIRGGSNSPSALLWSLDSLVQMSFIGGTAIWNFNTISDQSSILSSSGPVEYDGVYFWPGIDRWLTYNGVLRELPNDMNLDFFYKNLNFSQRQKVFGFKIPRRGEIWWCAPLFGATECNWAIIYNVRENSWYDTPLPADGRSAAYFPKLWPYPIMASAKGLTPIGQNTGTNYPIWQHEYGVDSVRGPNVDAIKSFIVSSDLSIVGGGLTGTDAGGDNVWTQLVRLEQDFNMGPSLNIRVYGRQFPMDNNVLLDSRTITQMPTNNTYDLQPQNRYIRWLVESNVQGGYYEFGSPQIHVRPGDRTP